MTFADLQADYEAAYQVVTNAQRAVEMTPEYRAGLEAENWDLLEELEMDLPEFQMFPHIVAFKTAAEQAAGTEVAVDFLNWLMINARRDEPATSAWAVTTLAADHMQSADLKKLVNWIFVVDDGLPEKPKEFLRRVIQ